MPLCHRRRRLDRIRREGQGAGSMPAAWRISHAVDAAIAFPSRASSPWIRLWPKAGFSRAIRTISVLTETPVDGSPTPGRLRSTAGRSRSPFREAPSRSPRAIGTATGPGARDKRAGYQPELEWRSRTELRQHGLPRLRRQPERRLPVTGVLHLERHRLRHDLLLAGGSGERGPWPGNGEGTVAADLADGCDGTCQGLLRSAGHGEAGGGRS